jgi:hypothetical protein
MGRLVCGQLGETLERELAGREGMLLALDHRATWLPQRGLRLGGKPRRVTILGRRGGMSVWESGCVRMCRCL